MGRALEQAQALMIEGKWPGLQGQPVKGKFQRFVPPNTIQNLFTVVHGHTKWPKKGNISSEYQEIALQLYMPTTTIVATSITGMIEKVVALRCLGWFMKVKFLKTEELLETGESETNCLMTIKNIRTHLSPLISPARYELINTTMESIVQHWATNSTVGYLCNRCSTGETCGHVELQA
jgi:hypothetical protein